jgi:hypothetical protein
VLGRFQDIFELLGRIVIPDALVRYVSEHARHTVIEFAR